MASEDDLARLAELYQRGEVSHEQYDTLRRQVVRGVSTPRPRRGERQPAQRQPALPQPAQPRFARAQVAQPRIGTEPGGAAAAAPQQGGRSAGRPRPAPRRRRRGPPLAAVLTSLVLAIALAGLGVWWFTLRATGTPAGQYAHSVCTVVQDWQRAVDARTSALGRSIARQTDQRQIRTAVTTYYGQLAARTETLRSALAGAGTPDVPDGSRYADALATAADGAVATLQDSAARAERLSRPTAASFQAALVSLVSSTNTAVATMTAALAGPASGTPAELRAAFDEDPTCTPYIG